MEESGIGEVARPASWVETAAGRALLRHWSRYGWWNNNTTALLQLTNGQLFDLLELPELNEELRVAAEAELAHRVERRAPVEGCTLVVAETRLLRRVRAEYFPRDRDWVAAEFRNAAIDNRPINLRRWRHGGRHLSKGQGCWHLRSWIDRALHSADNMVRFENG